MSIAVGGPRTAEEVRIRNTELDAELYRTVERITPGQLHAAPEEAEWTPAEILAHIAEFARFFTGNLERQLVAEGVEVGRTHEHPGRNHAIASASGRDLDDLRLSLKPALDELTAVLATLRDEHLGRIGNNRKYGPEPLAVFLDRYVLDHKAAHLDQLRQTLNRLPIR